jgi:hypothetical protein
VSEKLVQFLIVSDGELEMTWDDTGLLVVTGGVASQLEDFSCEVLKDGSEINGSTWKSLINARSNGKVEWLTSTDTLSVVALAEETMDTTDWECETSLGRAALKWISKCL